MTKRRRVLCCVLDIRVSSGVRRDEDKNALVRGGFTEQAQVDLKHRLEQTHVRTLIQTNLVFPKVDNKHLRGCEGEQGRLSLEVLSRS